MIVDSLKSNDFLKLNSGEKRILVLILYSAVIVNWIFLFECEMFLSKIPQNPYIR